MTEMRKFILVFVLFLGMIVVALSFSELETILKTLQHAHFLYLLSAVILQAIWFVVIGRMYRETYHLLDMDEATIILSKLAVAANFVNIVAPTGGVGGIALFAAEARRRGHPGGKATVAAALYLLFDQAAFLVVLALGLIILVRRNNLGAGEITASFIMLIIATAFASLFYIGYRSEQRLGDLLARMARFVNWIVKPFFHREYLSEARAHKFAHEISDGLSALTANPSSLVRPVLWGLLDKTLCMGILLCSFLSFEVPFSAGTIIAGFAIAYLFLIVSPTPSGIGVVEGVMPLALTSLRVDWSQAVVITLTYRAVTFWLPIAVGAWAFRSLHWQEKRPAVE
jgi:glycosyltransferase 2 family protein